MFDLWVRPAGFVLLVLTAAAAGACRSSVRPARSVAIVPRPPDAGARYVPALSRVAAQRIRSEIETRGFAAIDPSATARPDTCRVVDDSAASADLRLFVWIQQVDLPKPEFASEKPRVFGGLVIWNREGKELYTSRDVLATDAAAPSNEFFRLGQPDEGAARRAAEAFGAWLIGSPGRMSAALERALGGPDAEKPGAE